MNYSSKAAVLDGSLIGYLYANYIKKNYVPRGEKKIPFFLVAAAFIYEVLIE